MNKQATRASADPTRHAILEAARTLFVKNGFAGTSISEIAKRAGINQSLIYHHFNNKQDLWLSVKQAAKETYDDKHQNHHDTLFAFEKAEDFITHLLTYRFGIFDANPDIRRMIDWQTLEPEQDKLVGMSHEFLEQVQKRVQHFQTQGQIDPSLCPDLILTFIFNAPTGFWKSFKNLETTVPAEQLPAYKDQYLQMCIKTLIRGFVIQNEL